MCSRFQPSAYFVVQLIMSSLVTKLFISFEQRLKITKIIKQNHLLNSRRKKVHDFVSSTSALLLLLTPSEKDQSTQQVFKIDSLLCSTPGSVNKLWYELIMMKKLIRVFTFFFKQMSCLSQVIWNCFTKNVREKDILLQKST